MYFGKLCNVVTSGYLNVCKVFLQFCNLCPDGWCSHSSKGLLRSGICVEGKLACTWLRVFSVELLSLWIQVQENDLVFACMM